MMEYAENVLVTAQSIPVTIGRGFIIGDLLIQVGSLTHFRRKRHHELEQEVCFQDR
jgi:hypothetical protein